MPNLRVPECSVATLPEEDVNQHGQARARGARRGRIEALTSVGNTAASWGAKKFQQTRQRVPFFNWLIRCDHCMPLKARATSTCVPLRRCKIMAFCLGIPLQPVQPQWQPWIMAAWQNVIS